MNPSAEPASSVVFTGIVIRNNEAVTNQILDDFVDAIAPREAPGSSRDWKCPRESQNYRPG